MNNGEIAHLSLQLQFAEPLLVGVVQMIAGPLDRGLGHLVKIARRFEQGRLFVVISFYNWAIDLLKARNALVRIGVVTNYVSQTDIMGAPLLLGVVQHRFQRFEVGVNVTEDGVAHGWIVGMSNGLSVEAAKKS